MRLIALAAVALLSACATQPQPLPVLTPDIAQQMSAAELCLGLSTFRPGNAQTAGMEIQRRGINCQDHAQAVLILQQQRAQAANILLQQRAAQPAYQYKPYQLPVPTMPHQTVCTTERLGNQLQTVCR